MSKITLRILSLSTFVFLCSLLMAFLPHPQKKYKILLFTKTAGFHHNSIPVGIKAIQQLGEQNNFQVDTTTDSLQFNPKNLAQYKAVVFLNTTGNVLSEQQQKAFETYIAKGNGFVGVHAATDTEYDWPYYNKLVGAYFKNHPEQAQAKLIIKDKNFPATSHLPTEWSRWDEWYNFKDFDWANVHVLITIDESTYKGGGNGELHPVSWYHEFGGGRSFYTALGHTDESYADPMFLQHLLGGIKWATGN